MFLFCPSFVIKSVSDIIKIMKPRVLLLVILFLLVFFVNIPAFSQPCNWRVQCPDYVGVKVVAWYPNFYIPERTGGFFWDDLSSGLVN